MNHAIEWVQAQHALTPDKPFFVYLSFGATHAPHHVPTEWSDKYKGKFDLGWDKLREQTLANQKKLGVVPQDCQLTARSEGIPAWADLTDDAKKVAARLMEIYAGFAEHTDHYAGRVPRCAGGDGRARQHARLLHRGRQRRQRRGR